MQLARKLNAADEYVDLDRKNPERQWDELKTKYPYGFDVVVEASGVHQLLERGLDLTTRGGKLIFYGKLTLFPHNYPCPLHTPYRTVN